MRSGGDLGRTAWTLALVSAAAASVAGRPWGPGLVAWIALVPLIVALDREERWWRGALLAWIAWAGLGVVGFEGVLPVLPWAFPVLLLLAGTAWMAVGAGYVLIRTRLGTMHARATLPFLVVAAEFIASRRVVFGDLANPITSLAYTQIDTLFLRTAAWSGTSGTTLLVVTINVAIVLLLAGRWRSAAIAATAVAACLVLPVPGSGAPPLGTEPLRIGMVQDAHPSIEALMARMHAHPAERVLATLSDLSDGVADSADVVVWGETALPQPVRDGELAETTRRAFRDDAAYLVGVRERSDGTWFNSVLHAEAGDLRTVHRKRALVPWIERGFARGTEPGTVRVGRHRAGLGVCLDSMFGSLARDSVRAGAEVLVYLTDDTFALRFATPELHARASAVRAVETARPVVFVDRSGPSVAFDARGVLTARLPRGEPASVVVEATPGVGTTPFVRFGDWVGLASVAWSALAAFALVRRRPPRGDLVAEAGARTADRTSTSPRRR